MRHSPAIHRFGRLLACAILTFAGLADPRQPATFNRDVAPLLFEHCATCHSPDGDAPFPLLSYQDARKRGETICEVTARHYMPPWQPAPGPFPLVGERHLSETDIDVFRRWVDSGMPEGKPQDLPPPPKRSGAWELGEPDLIVETPEPFLLPADGPDIYRNLVLPMRGPSNRFVRAIQILPGSKAVHHGFLLVDKSGRGRTLDAKDAAPGFPGLDLPDGMESPGGHFLSWQPGRRSYVSPPGLTWVLPAVADLVVQLHLQPIGRPEKIAPRIGFYFTNRPPEREFFKLALNSLTIDIPAGDRQHLVEDSFTLPVAVSLIGVNPHCHYLGRDLRGLAVLPDGTTNELLHIPEWNFNWQGDYRFTKPVDLPRGTRLVMRYLFDNSTNNLRNPNDPPVRVRYGMRTQDEMAELWLQMLPQDQKDLAELSAAYQAKAVPEIVTYQEYRLRLNPQDAHAHARLGVAKSLLGDTEAAFRYLQTAVGLDSEDDYAHFNLGLLYQERNEPSAAEREFAEAVRINPANGEAQGSLGIALGTRGLLGQAERHLREALRLNPNDDVARSTLEEVVRLRKTAPKQ
jgi:mono/diheme cytochrome c family protein